MARKDSSSNNGDNAPKGGKIRTTVQQLGTAFRLTREVDRKLVPAMAGIGGAVFVILLVAGLVTGDLIPLAILGVLAGLLAALITFSRRAQHAMYTRMHGEFGAGASVLKSMLERERRRGWEVTEAVRVNRSRDMIHRVLGRPGIILVGEGNPNRLRALFAEERKHLTRLFGPEVVIHDKDIIVGDGEDQVPLSKLHRTMTKLRPALRPSQVNEYRMRLKAVGERQLPLPKGPIPRSGRMPRG
jgi:hypothetical protein